MDGALDRQRLQRAFHRRLFEIHPDTRAGKESSDQPIATQSDASSSTQFGQSARPAENPGKLSSKLTPAHQLSVDALIEARKTLLIRLERGSVSKGVYNDYASDVKNYSGNNSSEPENGKSAAVGQDGYSLYRKALFLYSEAVLEYFEKRKNLQGQTVSEPGAEPEGFRQRLEEARGLFVQVLERFPGGTWTPDAIEQIARINVWLKRNGPG